MADKMTDKRDHKVTIDAPLPWGTVAHIVSAPMTKAEAAQWAAESGAPAKVQKI